jgi:hypothetical protein
MLRRARPGKRNLRRLRRRLRGGTASRIDGPMRQARALPIRSRSIRFEREAVLRMALALGVACSPRSLPPSFPAGSAAGMETPEGPVRRVTRALDSDPPLPGESTEGWPGLETHAAAGEGEEGVAGQGPVKAPVAAPSEASPATELKCPDPDALPLGGAPRQQLDAAHGKAPSCRVQSPQMGHQGHQR